MVSSLLEFDVSPTEYRKGGDRNTMEPKRKYEFTWELLGDIGLGRPHLGPNTRLEVYRLMQFLLPRCDGAAPGHRKNRSILL